MGGSALLSYSPLAPVDCVGLGRTRQRCPNGLWTRKCHARRHLVCLSACGRGAHARLLAGQPQGKPGSLQWSGPLPRPDQRRVLARCSSLSSIDVLDVESSSDPAALTSSTDATSQDKPLPPSQSASSPPPAALPPTPGSPRSSLDSPTLQAIQAATSGKLAELQHAVEVVGPDLGEGATQQLEEVLHKLEQLEADLSAALHSPAPAAAPEQQQLQQQGAVVPQPGVSAVGVAAGPQPAAAALPSLSPINTSSSSSNGIQGTESSSSSVGDDSNYVVVMDGSLSGASKPRSPTAAAAVAAAAAEADALASSFLPGSPTASGELIVGWQGARCPLPEAGQGQPAAAAAAAAPGTAPLAGGWSSTEALPGVTGTATGEGSSPVAPSGGSSTVEPAAAAAGGGSADLLDSTKLWALFVLGLSYVHQATSGFALPAMLPMISPDLHLSDFQGALLTSGYSYLYALALVPVGLLADRVDRPKLLAVGLMVWSSLSMMAAGAGSFRDLLMTRIGFAAAQAAQNPVSFSLIPDLFPANKSTALAAYNCAIYLGRALSFAAVLVAHRMGGGGSAAVAEPPGGAAGEIALSMVPLEKLDLQQMSVIYTAGDMAAVTPVYNYNFNVIAYETAGMGGGGWRDLLTFIGYPGFVIAAMMLLSVKDPRKAEGPAAGGAGPSPLPTAGGTAPGALTASSSSSTSAAAAAAAPAWGEELALTSSSSGGSTVAVSGGAVAVSAGQRVNVAAPLTDWRSGVSNLSQKLPLDVLNRLLGHFYHAAPTTAISSSSSTPTSNSLTISSSTSSSTAVAGGEEQAPMDAIKGLLAMPAFQTTTLAAALNDLGSYALIAWHSTFYERVYGLDSSVYAPILAVILPVGGIVGGVGGGLIADWLSTVGGRYWLTAGASILAAPFIAQSLLADSSQGSFMALLVGFALSEAWRAPSAIMIRGVAPQELGSTASALYLCIRNLVGGLGPVAVAKLAEVAGLQHAMLLAPCCYGVSGLLFLLAEREIEDMHAGRKKQQQQMEAAGAEQEQKEQQQEGLAMVTPVVAVVEEAVVRVK